MEETIEPFSHRRGRGRERSCSHLPRPRAPIASSAGDSSDTKLPAPKLHVRIPGIGSALLAKVSENLAR